MTTITILAGTPKQIALATEIREDATATYERIHDVLTAALANDEIADKADRIAAAKMVAIVEETLAKLAAYTDAGALIGDRKQFHELGLTARRMYLEDLTGTLSFLSQFRTWNDLHGEAMEQVDDEEEAAKVALSEPVVEAAPAADLTDPLPIEQAVELAHELIAQDETWMAGTTAERHATERPNASALLRSYRLVDYGDPARRKENADRVAMVKTFAERLQLGYTEAEAIDLWRGPEVIGEERWHALLAKEASLIEAGRKRLRDEGVVVDTSLGAVIRRSRLAAGMTQAQLAERLGVSRSYVVNIEAGRETISRPETIRSYAEALGISPDVLFVAAHVVPPDVAALVLTDVHTVRSARKHLQGVTSRDRA